MQGLQFKSLRLRFLTLFENARTPVEALLQTLRAWGHLSIHMHFSFRPATILLWLALAFHCRSAGLDRFDELPLLLPAVGSSQLRILTPTILELTLITTQKQGAAKLDMWDFINEHGDCRLPSPGEFLVTAGDRKIAVSAVGFKRRVLYAPLKRRDLRIGNYLYLRLAGPVTNATIEVTNPDKKLWLPDTPFKAILAPVRYSPVIHVNQVGYLADYPKKAMVGYFLGSLGELDISATLSTNQNPLSNFTFQVLDTSSGRQVFHAPLLPRRDTGFPFLSYQQVLEADFSPLKKTGEYQLSVPGLGVSFPFLIDNSVSGAFARSYALGIYHQRCGTALALPFTRFAHKPCHTAPAEVPDMSRRFEHVNHELQNESANYKDNPRHTGPQLKNVTSSLYPFVNKGPIDVSGGHHDAGDYSKYTINSASFIHFLVFAADVFPGVADLDNLGLPESGDGKSDILQEVKWEADFLAKMQDADGGFYFLVYPRERTYEDNVLPDEGDPQVVFPKTTSATAAASAALAQCASSPTFKKQFPEAAALYLEKAKKGWIFLQRALSRFGKDGAYQKITHYGDEFMHDDELAWAACELFIATQQPDYHNQLLPWLDPSNPANRKWGWLRLHDAFGNDIRSYGFAARAGKIKRELLQPLLLEQCEAEIVAAGEEQLHRAQNSAYGTTFPDETKRSRSAGWYFSSDAAFDLAVAYQLEYPAKNDPRPSILEAILSNLNYEQGCNPINVDYLTGLGWRRQREIVHQYSQNDRRILPPDGIPLGNIQGGFGWLELYGKLLGQLSFPADDSHDAPYPFYDRWADSFNLSQEFVIPNQARALGYLAWLMAQTPLKNQPWTYGTAQFERLQGAGEDKTITAKFSAPEFDLRLARIVWEAPGQEPAFGHSFSFHPARLGTTWLEAEAQLPDGRRLFAVTNFPAAK